MPYVKIALLVAFIAGVAWIGNDYIETKKKVSEQQVNIDAQQRMIENQFDTILEIENAIELVKKSKESVVVAKEQRKAKTESTTKDLQSASPDYFGQKLNSSLQEILK